MSSVLMSGQLTGEILREMLPVLAEKLNTGDQYVFDVRLVEPSYTAAEIAAALDRFEHALEFADEAGDEA